MRNAHANASYDLLIEDADRDGQVLRVSIEAKSMITIVWSSVN
jgi:hypothetical protein